MSPWRRFDWPWPLLPLAITPLRQALEAAMAWHMLIEFPLLALAGALAARHWRGALPGALPCWLLVSAVGTVWMIPAALDAALLWPAVAGAKYLSWLLAGAALQAALRQSGPVLHIFFFGNSLWMASTVGLLYLDAPERLCVNYLLADQAAAGRGLLALAALCAACALWQGWQGAKVVNDGLQ